MSDQVAVNKPVDVAIVVVGYRNADDIGRCVAALAATDYPHRTIIVENGGPEAFAALRAAVGGMTTGGTPVLLIEATGNLGFAGGVNHGIRQAPHAGAYWVLNPDAVPAPDALGELVARLEHGDCEAVGGVLHFADGRVQSLGGEWQSWLARAVSIGAGEQIDAPIDAEAVESRLDYLVGASMLIHRRFIETVGLMREDYFLYVEEIEWFLRGARHGMRLGIAPRARVLHHQGTTTGWNGSVKGRPKMPIYLDERNRVLLTRDRFPRRMPLVAVTSLLFMLARYGRKRAWRQIGFGVQGWAAGLTGKRGVPAWVKS
ncbi:MAG: glycosyltransferase family 2 protein [Novosphingobium sp.]